MLLSQSPGPSSISKRKSSLDFTMLISKNALQRACGCTLVASLAGSSYALFFLDRWILSSSRFKFPFPLATACIQLYIAYILIAVGRLVLKLIAALLSSERHASSHGYDAIPVANDNRCNLPSLLHTHQSRHDQQYSRRSSSSTRSSTLGSSSSSVFSQVSDSSSHESIFAQEAGLRAKPPVNTRVFRLFASFSSTYTACAPPILLAAKVVIANAALTWSPGHNFELAELACFVLYLALVQTCGAGSSRASTARLSAALVAALNIGLALTCAKPATLRMTVSTASVLSISVPVNAAFATILSSRLRAAVNASIRTSYTCPSMSVLPSLRTAATALHTMIAQAGLILTLLALLTGDLARIYATHYFLGDPSFRGLVLASGAVLGTTLALGAALLVLLPQVNIQEAAVAGAGTGAGADADADADADAEAEARTDANRDARAVAVGLFLFVPVVRSGMRLMWLGKTPGVEAVRLLVGCAASIVFIGYGV